MMRAVYGGRRRNVISRCLADALLAGVWNERSMLRRAGLALDRRPAWLRPVVREVLGAYHRPPADRPRELAAFVAAAIERRPRAADDAAPPRVTRWYLPEPQMGRRRWPVPPLASPAEVAAFLELSEGELAWLADTRSLERRVADESLRNYAYTWLARGGRPVRVIERPKHRLKTAQRRLLHELLDWIPAHPRAHGFTRGRSALTNAAAHVGRTAVVRLDLEDFFASIDARRIYGIFRTAGYPESVAHVLTALTTNVVPESSWAALPRPGDPRQIAAHHALGRRLATPHLPQGAPTSPALANLAAFALDRRLSGLAAALDATYTRYADDMTFSGGRALASRCDAVRAKVAAIARDEGLRVNERKSAVMTRAGRQRVCGIVVNERPNVARTEYDRLKAILHNAAMRGPAAENRAGVADFRAHLLGRIAWVESTNRARGAKLRARFDRIDWAGETAE